MPSARTQGCVNRTPSLLIAAMMALMACATGKPTAPTEADVSDTATVGDSGAEPPVPVSDTVTVRVLDDVGSPVEAAVVTMGGWSESDWVRTDADGEATIPIVDNGYQEQYLLAGKVGWFSGGTAVDLDALPTVVIDVTLRPLPARDNLDYAFLPGGDGSSPDTSQCGHCHWTIGDDWAGSSHAKAASSPNVWDVYTGSASSVGDEEMCAEKGGWWAEGQLPGQAGETVERCYLGAGVLPWLHEGCGGPAEPACDHPDIRASLTHFGSCGDCHSPAVDGGIPGEIDLASATGVAFEGVTCDLCHKVQSVTADTSPGLDGGISLLRSDAPSLLPNLEHEAITFGPYPDVIVPIMNGSYTPQFRDAEWCASCHEYAQPGLHPDETGLVNSARWPDGLPIFETWSEFSGSAMAESLTCQTCHMPPLAEESSTYDMTPRGLEPSVDQGWLREAGEVRHHSFSSDGLGGPSLDIVLALVDGEIEARVTVSNGSAGHAVPTGEPMKQLLVRVSATDAEGAVVTPSGGQVISDMGGYIARGTIGDSVSLTDTTLRFEGLTLPDEGGLRVRFARPTGTWVDYAGPGTAGFSSDDLTPEDKGIAGTDFVAEVGVSTVEGDTVWLDGPIPVTQAGDQVSLVRSEDDAGAPGWLYAKVLADASGARGVAHYRAVSIVSDNRIAPGGEGTSVHRFPVSADRGEVVVEATLIRRYRGASVADLFDWDRGDVVLRTVSETVEP